MAKTSYTIEGSSTVKPVGLPEGFEVRENTVLFDREVSGFTLSDSDYQESSLFIKHDNLTSRHLRRGDVTALRDVLSEWLDETKPALRVVHDSSDSANTDWRWYEVWPDKFLYNKTPAEAREESKNKYAESEALSYEDINERYGIRTVMFWEG